MIVVYAPLGACGLLAFWFTWSSWRAVKKEGHVRIFHNLSVDSDSISSELRWAWLLAVCVAGLVAGTVAIAEDRGWGSPLFTSAALATAFSMVAAFLVAPRHRDTIKHTTAVAFYSPGGATATVHDEDNVRRYNPRRHEEPQSRSTKLPLQVTPLRVYRSESERCLVGPVPGYSLADVPESRTTLGQVIEEEEGDVLFTRTSAHGKGWQYEASVGDRLDDDDEVYSLGQLTDFDEGSTAL
jgi:hypothetical protein